MEFAAKFNLVDFEVVTLDSTTIEASVDEYRRLKYEQIIYLENLIKKYGKSKGKKEYLEKIKKILLIINELDG